MMTYTENFTSEELFNKAANGDQKALWTLCKRYEPLFKSEAKIYHYKMADLYDTEDFLSVGYELIWELTKKQNFKGGSFGSYLKQAVRNRFNNTFRNFAAKNMVCISDTEDCRGEVTRTYTVDEAFQDYKEKQKVRNADWRRRKIEKIDAERAAQGLPKIYRKSLATAEEKEAHDAAVKARARENVKRYQKEHAAEIAEKKAAYYQNPEVKERYRLNSAILRARKSIERYETIGDTKRSAEARERLARYEEERQRLRAS